MCALHSHKEGCSIARYTFITAESMCYFVWHYEKRKLYVCRTKQTVFSVFLMDYRLV